MGDGCFRVSRDHPCLHGHFPGRPLVPGVVILDHVLDAIERTHGPLGALRLTQVKFLQPLFPDERANVVLEPVDRARWRFRVLRGAVVLATGEVCA
ncbi:MAG: hypothetical protein ACR2J7_08190 [Luteimonas sp.]